MTPATLALITAVGPPDCATNKFPANSAIGLQQISSGVSKRAASKRPIPDEIEPTPCQRRKRLSKGNPDEGAGGNSKDQAPSSREISSSKLQITPPTVAGPFLGFWELTFI